MAEAMNSSASESPFYPENLTLNLTLKDAQIYAFLSPPPCLQRGRLILKRSAFAKLSELSRALGPTPAPANLPLLCPRWERLSWKMRDLCYRWRRCKPVLMTLKRGKALQQGALAAHPHCRPLQITLPQRGHQSLPPQYKGGLRQQKL